MGNTKPIPMDIMERLERLERRQWRPDVSTASFGEPQQAMSDDVSARLDAIEERLSTLEGSPNDG